MDLRTRELERAFRECATIDRYVAWQHALSRSFETNPKGELPIAFRSPLCRLPVSDLWDWDWREVFKYGAEQHVVTVGAGVSSADVTAEGVRRVLALTRGENDGPPWCALLELHDDRWAYISADCDYTGWG